MEYSGVGQDDGTRAAAYNQQYKTGLLSFSRAAARRLDPALQFSGQTGIKFGRSLQVLQSGAIIPQLAGCDLPQLRVYLYLGIIQLQ